MLSNLPQRGKVHSLCLLGMPAEADPTSLVRMVLSFRMILPTRIAVRSSEGARDDGFVCDFGIETIVEEEQL